MNETKDDLAKLHATITDRINTLKSVANSHDGVINSLIRERDKIDDEITSVEARRATCTDSIRELDDVLHSILTLASTGEKVGEE